MRSIRNLMTTSPVAFQQSEAIGSVIQTMVGRNIGAVLVVEQDRLVGILTERDLLRIFASAERNILTRPVSEFMTRDPIRVEADDDLSAVFIKMQTNGIRHLPVMEAGRLCGILSVRDLLQSYQRKVETDYFEARREIERLQGLLGLSPDDKVASLIGEVKRYEGLSLTDHLTGLYNLRYFQLRMNEEIGRAARYRSPLSIIFCDIDHFKSVNDRYGHQAGDEILKEVSRLLSAEVKEDKVISRLRKSDIVARYGGEEFVVVLPETTPAGAALVAERIRKAIESHRFVLKEAEARLTMSFGVTGFIEEAMDYEGMVKTADDAMYQAKNGGRNRVALIDREQR